MRAEDIAPRTWLLGALAAWALLAWILSLAGLGGRVAPLAEDPSLVQRLPATFASVSAINGALTGLWVQSLPDNYYQQYTKSVMSITAEDVVRAARTHLDLDHLAIVIVGDRKAIEEPLRATKIAPIAHLDIEGDPTN